MSRFAFVQEDACAFLSELVSLGQKGKTGPVPNSRIAKTKMTVTEREGRSRLNQLIADRGLLRGTLRVCARTCGKPNCKCVRGEKHESLYLVVSEDGKLRHIFVPRSMESDVRVWVEQYQRAQELLENLSQIHREKLRKREK